MKFFVVLGFLPLVLAVSCAKKVDSPLHSRAMSLPSCVSVVFSGDFMQHFPQITAARSADTFDYDTQLRHIAPLWRSADFAMLNLETTLTDDEKRYSGYPLFAAPTVIAAAIKRAGITHVALANNHCVDKGLRGVTETIDALNKAQIGHTGMWADSSLTPILMLEKRGLKIAVLNYTYSTNGNVVPQIVKVNFIDTAAIATDIALAKCSGATNVVVFYHWGNEYATSASKSQSELALWTRQRGVDAVIGSHPHVVEQIDAVDRIVYSLGNLVSNQSNRFTDVGISVRLTFCDGVRLPRIEYIPHQVDLKATGVKKYTITLPSKAVDLSAINDIRNIVKR